MNVKKTFLEWPVGIARTPELNRSSLQIKKIKRPVSPLQAIDKLMAAFKCLGVPDWQIRVTMNLQVGPDGIPTGKTQSCSDPGVAVYWKYDENSVREHVIAVDKYHRISDNIAAIALALGAFGTIKTVAGGPNMDRALEGLCHQAQ